MMKGLIASSVLMLGSVVSGNGKIAAIGLTIWFVMVFATLFRITGFNVKDFAHALTKKTDESLEEKKYTKAGVYAVTMPLIILGLLVAILQIGVLFFAN